MGCDIHIYAEYWYDYELKSSRNRYWDHYATSLCKDFCIGRNYSLFNIMAGVRGDGLNSISLPRGLPKEPKISHHTLDSASLIVVPDKELNLKNYVLPSNVISESKLEELKQNANIEYITTTSFGSTMKQCPVIYDPDYHSFSWLNLQELLEVRKRFLNEQVFCTDFEVDFVEVKKLKEYKKILKNVIDPLELFKHNFGALENPAFNALLGMMFAAEKSDNDLKTRIVFWFDS